MFAQKLPQAVIKDISAQVRKQSGINLGQGIPSLPVAPQLAQKVVEMLNDPQIHIYPHFQGIPELRNALAEKLNTDYRLNLDPDDHLLITVGAMQGTASVILSLVDSAQKVGIITPDYSNHFPQIILGRGDIIEIPMIPTENSWELDIEKIEPAAKDGMQLLILTNPNNPTGAVVDASQLEKIVALSKKYDFWVLIDETYNYLSYGKKPGSILEFFDRSEKLVCVRSFSKEYVMTGWRVGYVVAHNEALALFMRTHDALVGCASHMSQYAALAALSAPQDYFFKNVTELTHRRNKAIKHAIELSDHTSFIPAQGAYYLFLKLPVFDDVAFAKRSLEELNVGVIPGSIFGEAGRGYVRLSFSVAESVFESGIEKLKELLQKG